MPWVDVPVELLHQYEECEYESCGTRAELPHHCVICGLPPDLCVAKYSPDSPVIERGQPEATNEEKEDEES